MSHTTGKIALEEHFALPDTVPTSKKYFHPDAWRKIPQRLVDIHGQRLEEMDRNGIDLMFLSLNSPGTQGIYERRCAIELARRANDYLAEEICRNTRRFEGFCGSTDAGPRGGGRGVDAQSEAARVPRSIGQRVLSDRSRRFRGLLRPSAVLALLGRPQKGLAYRFTSIPEIHSPATYRATRGIPGWSGRRGGLDRTPPSTRCGRWAAACWIVIRSLRLF